MGFFAKWKLRIIQAAGYCGHFLPGPRWPYKAGFTVLNKTMVTGWMIIDFMQKISTKN